jgi:hypothetical protein
MKTELRSLILAGALCASTTAFAQGKVEFDWKGTDDRGIPLQNPYFQGSLIIDASLVYPNSVFWPGADQWPGAAATGMTITSPDHSWSGDGGLDGLASPWTLSPGGCSRFDQFGILVLYVWANDGSLFVGQSSSGSDEIRQFYMDGGALNVRVEPGRWVQAPEPSAFVMLGLGLLGLYMKKAASR